MTRNIVGFVPDIRPLLAHEWFQTRKYHRDAGHKALNGGVETTPCTSCGFDGCVCITFLGDETDMSYVVCPLCHHVKREWAVYETDVKP